MLKSKVDKIYRDCILGHSLEGMDVHYMAPSEEDLHIAMDYYTMWFDNEVTKIQDVSKNVSNW